MRFRLQGLCNLYETIPNTAFDRFIVLRAAAASGLLQRPHRAALDEARQSVAHHAVRNPRTRIELLRRRTVLVLQGEDNLGRLLVAEQGGGSAARLSWFFYQCVYYRSG
jgi:hypothetical protein